MGTAPCAPSASGGRRGVLHTGVSRPVACRLGARSPSLRVSPVRSRWQLPLFGPRRTSRRGGRQDADPRRSRPRLSRRKRLLPRPRAEAAHLEGQGSFSAFNLDLRPGDGLETYTVTAAQASFNTSYPLPNIRHVAVRFIGAEGARLEIASMRLVTLKEHFVSIPSGVGWHGLSEVFRETVVTRSPESVSFPVDLSSRPWLDVAIGIVDNGPVTFHIAVDAGVVGARTRSCVADRDLQDFLSFAYWTGMRKGETAFLTCDAFNREAWTLTLSAKDATTRKPRTIAVEGALRLILASRLQRRRSLPATRRNWRLASRNTDDSRTNAAKKAARNTEGRSRGPCTTL